MSVINSIKSSINVITGCGSGLGRATLEWFIKNKSGPILAIDCYFPENFLNDIGLTRDQKNLVTLKQHFIQDKETDDSVGDFGDKHGRIDNLVNVAGVAMAHQMYNRNNPETIYNLEHAENLTDFNILGTFNMIRLVSKYMANDDERKPKCIINTSCISTTWPYLGQNFYSGSKAAIDSMTLPVARDLARYNIRCNTINVGFFNTPLLSSSDDVKRFLSLVALAPKKLGDPIEFAHLVKTIIENQMINGACIRLDAGARGFNS